MATAVQLRLNAGNTEHVEFDPVWQGSDPYDLTGITLTCYLKTSAAVPDSDPSVVVITQAPSPAGVITVTGAAAGQMTLTIDQAVISSPGTLFWHLDARDPSGAVGTICYGPVYVEDSS